MDNPTNRFKNTIVKGIQHRIILMQELMSGGNGRACSDSFKNSRSVSHNFAVLFNSDNKFHKRTCHLNDDFNFVMIYFVIMLDVSVLILREIVNEL